MDYAAPQLRLSTANILTDLGWLAGTFHGPRAGRLRAAIVSLFRVTGITEWEGSPG